MVHAQDVAPRSTAVHSRPAAARSERVCGDGPCQGQLADLTTLPGCLVLGLMRSSHDPASRCGGGGAGAAAAAGAEQQAGPSGRAGGDASDQQAAAQQAAPENER